MGHFFGPKIDFFEKLGVHAEFYELAKKTKKCRFDPVFAIFRGPKGSFYYITAIFGGVFLGYFFFGLIFGYPNFDFKLFRDFSAIFFQ